MCVLAAIKDEESYGYQILKDMSPYAAMSESTLYTILKRLEMSDMLLVCGTELSKGMKGEISHAAKLGIPIMTFDDDLYIQVRKLVTKAGASKHLVSMDRNHTVLGLGQALIVPEEGGDAHA